jgi:hypothetical protein
MGYKEAQVEYNRTEELLNTLAQFSRRMTAAQKELETAQLAIEGNKTNLEALSSIERTLRNVRVQILSELAGVAKLYGVL